MFLAFAFEQFVPGLNTPPSNSSSKFSIFRGTSTCLDPAPGGLPHGAEGTHSGNFEQLADFGAFGGTRRGRLEAGGDRVGARGRRRAGLAVHEHEVEEIPYGLRVSDDGMGLVASETERQIVIVALDMIVEDRPLSQVADELNRRGHTTREGNPWTPSALFTLLAADDSGGSEGFPQ